MSWNLTTDKSVYLQLIDIIQEKILAGEYKPGEKLPGVREMAADAAVNPNTMQRALAELERTGLLYTQRTNGRFVADDSSLILKAKNRLAEHEVENFVQHMQQLGFTKDELRTLMEHYL